jgi:hypothetical protein
MATLSKRRNGDGSISWGAMVRVTGYPATGKSFRTKLAAQSWAARTEAAAKGGTLACARGMTFGHLLDEALPRLKNPTTAVFGYWREHLGDVRLGVPRRYRFVSMPWLLKSETDKWGPNKKAGVYGD